MDFYRCRIGRLYPLLVGRVGGTALGSGSAQHVGERRVGIARRGKSNRLQVPGLFLGVDVVKTRYPQSSQRQSSCRLMSDSRGCHPAGGRKPQRVVWRRRWTFSAVITSQGRSGTGGAVGHRQGNGGRGRRRCCGRGLWTAQPQPEPLALGGAGGQKEHQHGSNRQDEVGMRIV